MNSHLGQKSGCYNNGSEDLREEIGELDLKRMTVGTLSGMQFFLSCSIFCGCAAKLWHLAYQFSLWFFVITFLASFSSFPSCFLFPLCGSRCVSTQNLALTDVFMRSCPLLSPFGLKSFLYFQRKKFLSGPILKIPLMWNPCCVKKKKKKKSSYKWIKYSSSPSSPWFIRVNYTICFHCTISFHTKMWNLKNKTKNRFTELKQTPRCRKQTGGCRGRKVGDEYSTWKGLRVPSSVSK